MREIKFRGRLVFEGNALYKAEDKWVYGYLFYKEGKTWIQSYDGMTSWRVVPDSEAQYTGSKDEDGEDIYEKHVIRNTDGEEGVVVFTNGSFYMQYIPPHNWDPMVPAEGLAEKNNNGKYRYKIIGDTYENPELLKEKK